MSRPLTFALCAFLLCVSNAFAQDWASKMFETKSHDFGIVAKDSKTEFEFPLSNIYVEDIHIASARSSCGCTIVTVPKPDLKTYDKGSILARFNTAAFTGQRGATVTVVFDRPYYAEVQLQVKGFIRTDVVFNPGSVQLGSLEQGRGAVQQVNVNYNGYPNWQLTEVRSSNPNIKGQVVETSRVGNQATYQLTVQVDPKAPAGYFKDHLMLLANDEHQIPFLVEGRIVSGITVSPSTLFMGVVQPGQKVVKHVVVQSSRPFKVLSVACDDANFQFGKTGDESEAKPVHLIPVTFVAGHQPGKVNQSIRIVTDLGATPSELLAHAVVADNAITQK